MTVSTQPTTGLSTGLSTIDFLNGKAICILVKEGAVDSYTSFSFSDGREDFFSLMKRNFTQSVVEVNGSVVTRLGKEGGAEVYIYLPHAFRSTSDEALWEEICRLGNELIGRARAKDKEAKIAELEARIAVLRA